LRVAAALERWETLYIHVEQAGADSRQEDGLIV